MKMKTKMKNGLSVLAVTAVVLVLVATLFVGAGAASSFSGGPAAQIGDTNYTTLQAAIDAAVDNDVIIILRDINIDQVVNVGKKLNLTIDGKDYAIKQEASLATSSPHHVFNFGTQAGAADGNYTVKNLKIDGFTTGTYFIRCENCNVSFENCTVSNNILDTANSRILLETNAAVSLKNCTFDSNKADMHIVDLNSNTVSHASVPNVRIEGSLFNNNTAGHDLIYMSDVYGDTRIMDSSFTENHVGNKNEEAAIVYLSGKVNVTGSLFKDNEIASTTSSAKVGVIATGGSPEPDGSLITGNAFDANTITADNVVSGTIYLKAHTVNLSENYWNNGKAPSMGDKMDIYLHSAQEGMILNSYADAYQIHPNGRGITVSVYAGVTITFNGNGADSGSMEVQSAKKGSDVILSPNNYTKANYDFIGWNRSSASGTTVDYVNLGLVPSISQSMTLYAVWKDQIKPSIPAGTVIEKSTSSETATNITVTDSSNLSVDKSDENKPVAVLISDTANVTMTYQKDGFFNSSTAVNGTIVSIVVEPKLGDTVLGPTQDTSEKNNKVLLNIEMNKSEPDAIKTSIPQLIVAVNATKAGQLATQLNVSGTKYIAVGAMIEGKPQGELSTTQMNKNITNVNMTLYVNASWVKSHGKDNIKVYHIADNGTLTEMGRDFIGQIRVNEELFEKIRIQSSLGFSGYSVTAVW
ncbi:MAG TPA: InlB B-repeat-containing protein, partial [Methanocorpusculum sp.]|nr:InlB B-repeat-containing protein [Methanocorpusculum sp.]